MHSPSWGPKSQLRVCEELGYKSIFNMGCMSLWMQHMSRPCVTHGYILFAGCYCNIEGWLRVYPVCGPRGTNVFPFQRVHGPWVHPGGQGWGPVYRAASKWFCSYCSACSASNSFTALSIWPPVIFWLLWLLWCQFNSVYCASTMIALEHFSNWCGVYEVAKVVHGDQSDIH